MIWWGLGTKKVINKKNNAYAERTECAASADAKVEQRFPKGGLLLLGGDLVGFKGELYTRGGGCTATRCSSI
jgi:hypothetical protein